jgi:uncharacterized cupin superfamily protein
MARHKHVINIDDIEEKEIAVEEKFHHAVKGLGSSTGGVKLGCSYFRVAVGRYAFPLHSHHANEEATFVISGNGTLTLGPDEIPISAGDYASMPPDPKLRHKLVNTGDTDLVYLCLSTNIVPEITEYPDPGKIGVFGGADWNQVLADFHAGKDVSDQYVPQFHNKSASVGYFDGEV